MLVEILEEIEGVELEEVVVLVEILKEIEGVELKVVVLVEILEET